MIIPKESKLTTEQLAEVKGIVEEYGCKVQSIVGHHRTIYAVLGEERKTILVNRILGCLLYTSPSPRDRTRSRMPSSA